MEKCVFCVPGIEKFSFLTSDNFMALYNRSPILPGHSLVIPKAHLISLLDMPTTYLSEMMTLSVEAAKLLVRIFEAEAFDWTIQNGWAAGQTIPHLHLHIIPRKTGDLLDPGDWYQELEKEQKIDSDRRPKLSDEEMLSITEFIKGKADI